MTYRKWTQEEAGIINKARQMVSAAIQRGEIVKPTTCSNCGRKCSRWNLEAHHDDYSKPLEIRWLCRKPCHRDADIEMRRRFRSLPDSSTPSPSKMNLIRTLCQFEPDMLARLQSLARIEGRLGRVHHPIYRGKVLSRGEVMTLKEQVIKQFLVRNPDFDTTNRWYVSELVRVMNQNNIPITVDNLEKSWAVIKFNRKVKPKLTAFDLVMLREMGIRL